MCYTTFSNKKMLVLEHAEEDTNGEDDDDDEDQGEDDGDENAINALCK